MNKLKRMIADVLYASVGIVAFTSRKAVNGYEVLVDEGQQFTEDVMKHYKAKKSKSKPYGDTVNMSDFHKEMSDAVNG